VFFFILKILSVDICKYPQAPKSLWITRFIDTRADMGRAWIWYYTCLWIPIYIPRPDTEFKKET